ncbi:uncharacterized protein LOC118757334 [Rhagoletis pomonella]|uniref:uncharacterized protein LOC118757334 n=1 Tax=Rhagoletis pomonella TaxID=28610 RepID=UPI001784C477|nr:uncharacterized protein LOC118757334 [Rhagoletis pomonella]
MQSQKFIKCAACHSLTDCDEFKALARQSRWQFVKDKKLCIRCFKNHLVRRCKSNKLCGIDGCRLVHNPLLHRRSEELRNTEDTTGKPESNAVCLHQKQCEKVLFRYIPVTLHANGRAVDTIALIDEGASCTLLDEFLAHKLMLTGPTEELCLRWTGNITQQEPNSKIVSLEISARGTDLVKYSLHKVRTLANLDLPQQSLQMNVIEKRQHLKSLPILPYSECKAGILIGLDHAKLSLPLEIRESKDDGLIATRCKLGWSVYGRDGREQLTEARLMHICPCTKYSDLDTLMRSYFSFEAVGISPYVKPLVSTEDERALKIMEKTTRYIAHEKRWETGLLWRYDHVDLPDSYAMARKRLECLEKKMNKNAALKDYL